MPVSKPGPATQPGAAVVVGQHTRLAGRPCGSLPDQVDVSDFSHWLDALHSWHVDSAARIVKRYAQRAGLDPAAYAGHSLRSGFLTSAAETGASIWKLSEVSRHKSLDTLRGYVRRVDLFKEHAGAAFL